MIAHEQESCADLVTLQIVLSVATLVLALASAAPAAEAALSPPSPSTRVAKRLAPHGNLLDELTASARRFGDGLLAVSDVTELGTKLATMIADEQFLHELVRTSWVFPEVLAELQAALADDVDEATVLESIATLLPHTSPALRAMVQHGVQISFDTLRRIPVNAIPPPPPSNAIGSLKAEIESDANLRTLLSGSASGYAVVRLLMPNAPVASASVVEELARRWFEAVRRTLALVDPLQAALDRGVEELPEPMRGAVLRVAYAWDVDQPQMTVWFVLRDDVPVETRAVSGNVALMRPIASELEKIGVGAPFFLRLRLASETA